MEETLSFISFTNKGKLVDLNYKGKELRQFWNEREFNQSTPFVLIKSDNSSEILDKIPEDLNEFEMLVVYDCPSGEDLTDKYKEQLEGLFQKLIDIPSRQYSVIHHTNQNQEVLNLLKILDTNDNVTLQLGMHEPDDENYKDTILYLIGEIQTNGVRKTQIKLKVKAETNEHEAKLDFLHRCLTPSGLFKKEVTQSEWAQLEEYKNLATKAKDGSFGPNYISALRILRDKLLVA
jgi:hypothetical protein